MKTETKQEAQDKILTAIDNLVNYDEEITDEQREYIRKQGFLIAKKFGYADGSLSLRPN